MFSCNRQSTRIIVLLDLHIMTLVSSQFPFFKTIVYPLTHESCFTRSCYSMTSASVHKFKKIISLTDLYTTSAFFSSICEDGVACVAAFFFCVDTGYRIFGSHHRRITFPLLIHGEGLVRDYSLYLSYRYCRHDCSRPSLNHLPKLLSLILNSISSGYTYRATRLPRLLGLRPSITANIGNYYKHMLS